MSEDIEAPAKIVMAALDPAISGHRASPLRLEGDARIRSGHDENWTLAAFERIGV